MSLWDDMGLTGKRVLIMHQDDIGLSDAANRAYLSLGLPTGSIMMPGAWAMQVKHGDLGVHLTLTSEWDYPRMRPLTEGRSLRDDTGYFWATLEQAWLNIRTEEAARELRAQIDMSFRLGIDPTHVDTHMGSVLRPDIAEIYHQLAIEYRLPAFLPENLENAGIPNIMRAPIEKIRANSPLPKVFWIDSYSVNVEPRRDWYIETLSNLKPGVYHFIHHAAESTPEGQRLPDWQKRQGDYEALKDPEVRRLLSELTLITYRDVRDAMRKYL